MPHLVAAPDKFKGTATAGQVADAAIDAGRRAGWSGDAVPMSDGGEGLLEAARGHARSARVHGPNGGPVDAQWRLVDDTLGGRRGADGGNDGGAEPTAVIEMAQAGGLVLAGGREHNDPMRATTRGVGELVLAAVEAGARRIIVGCGGSATTDGGLGAVEAIGDRARLGGAQLVVAVDVLSPFLDAAPVFAPQKGATPEQVLLLTDRLELVADRYESEQGVDVRSLPGAGAAGGLAGGLAALGARIVPGFDLVADLVDLPARLARADLVVTGEGRLDSTSFAGKVVGGVLSLVAGRVPVLCVVGDTAPDVVLPDEPGLQVVRLVEVAGSERAHREVPRLVAEVVGRALAAT